MCAMVDSRRSVLVGRLSCLVTGFVVDANILWRAPGMIACRASVETVRLGCFGFFSGGMRVLRCGHRCVQ